MHVLMYLQRVIHFALLQRVIVKVACRGVVLVILHAVIERLEIPLASTLGQVGLGSSDRSLRSRLD